MDLERGRKLALKLMKEHKLNGWKFVWTDRKRGLGQCRFSTKELSFSKYFVGANTRFFVKGVILHEIAHVLVGKNHSHDGVFKQKCKEIGTSFDGCQIKAKMPDEVYKWKSTCSGCGEVHKRINRPNYRTSYSCGACKLKVPLTFRKMK